MEDTYEKNETLTASPEQSQFIKNEELLEQGLEPTLEDTAPGEKNFEAGHEEKKEHLRQMIRDALQEPGEQKDAAKSVVEGTAFHPVVKEKLTSENAESEESGGLWKKITKGGRKAVLTLGITLGVGGALAKDAHGQEKKTDKNVTKTEVSSKSMEENAPLSETIKKEWNAYVKHLDEIHLKGSKTLDNYEASIKALNEWREEVKAETGHYPSLSANDLEKIQKELIIVKKYLNDRIRTGKAYYKLDANGKPSRDTIAFDEKRILAKDAEGDIVAGAETTNTVFPINNIEYEVARQKYVDKITKETVDIEVLKDSSKTHHERETIQVPPEYRK